MADCVLCDDPETSHEVSPAGDRFLGRCRTRYYHGPGRDDYVLCHCPGYEPPPEPPGE